MLQAMINIRTCNIKHSDAPEIHQIIHQIQILALSQHLATFGSSMSYPPLTTVHLPNSMTDIHRVTSDAFFKIQVSNLNLSLFQFLRTSSVIPSIPNCCCPSSLPKSHRNRFIPMAPVTSSRWGGCGLSFRLALWPRHRKLSQGPRCWSNSSTVWSCLNMDPIDLMLEVNGCVDNGIDRQVIDHGWPSW